MIKTEFGIIPNIKESEFYITYEPEKYNCVTIDDDLYIDDWWPELIKMNTYFSSLNIPRKGLARDGITLIPPESLSIFENIVKNDNRINSDESLNKLLSLIQKANLEHKYVIHYGV